MDPSVVAKMLEDGRMHLRFCAKLYRRQLRGNRHFLHEHPATAFSWREPEIDALVNDRRTYAVVCDQCQFGLITPSADKKSQELAMKPTRFLTSSSEMAEGLDKRCDRSHRHQHLVGGRAAAAAFYPLPLVRAILRGIRATADAERFRDEGKAERLEYAHAMASTQGSVPPEGGDEFPSSHITRTNGGKVKVDYTDDSFRPRYIDEYTGEVLTPSLIRAAIVEELNYFNDNQIWQLEVLSKVKASAEAVRVRTRWVLCNKGDASNPDMRARLVACEVNKTGKKDAFDASTPPGKSQKA